MTDIDRVSQVICRIGKLPSIPPDRDFYQAGVSSLSALELLVELEAEFDVTISDDEFIAARTPEALAALVAKRREGGAK